MGEAQFYFNRISETNYKENVHSVLGLTPDLSEWSPLLSNVTNQRDTRQMDLENECYGCWHYVAVVVDTPAEARYQLSFSTLRDAGSDFELLHHDRSMNFEMDKAIERD